MLYNKRIYISFFRFYKFVENLIRIVRVCAFIETIQSWAHRCSVGCRYATEFSGCSTAVVGRTKLYARYGLKISTHFVNYRKPEVV